MKIMLDEGAKMPMRAHPFDGGLDLCTPVDVVVPGCTISGWIKSFLLGGSADVGCATIDTLVHTQIPEGAVGFIKSKSGLNVKHGLTADGYCFKAGDKIAQLVILPCLLPELELVDSLEETDRGDGGFGSTGR